ncbi:unnamed protein product [Linum trigynum]|uniref:Uncharacterized protein n=1 Tax=Linum trigynum TaxID=586398 RepID=A0AAV2DBH4_9ROSI
MPTKYTASSHGTNRRLALLLIFALDSLGVCFRAQIRFSQIIMLNDRLSKTVDDNTVEIANLKKSLSDGREGGRH